MATRKSLILNAGLLQELNSSADKLDLAGNSTSDLSEGTIASISLTPAHVAL